MGLVRYSEDGVLDTDFGDQGFALLKDGDDPAFELALGKEVVQQADGKLVAVGKNFIARFNINGTLDTSFDTDGFNTLPGDVVSYIYSIAQQSDGGFLVTHAIDGDYAIVRYLSTGALDTGFGTSGTVTTDVGNVFNRPSAIIVDDTDDRFLVAGSGINGVDKQVVLLRYNADGSLDTSFSGDGKTEATFGDIDNFGVALSQQTDSKYVVAAKAKQTGDEDFATLRFDNDGDLDTGFNSTGIKVDWIGHPTKDIGYALAVQSDGKLIAGGAAAYEIDADLSSPTDIAMTRYLADGTLDTGFANEGRVMDSIMEPYSGIRALINQTDDKIVSLIQTWDGAASGKALIRYDINGARDTGFGTEGTGVVALDYAAYSGIQRSDGKLVLAAPSQLQRFELSGIPDAGFGDQGVVTPTVCPCSGGSFIEQTSGKLVIAGVNGVERYLDNGVLDETFAVAGKLSLPENIGGPWLVQQPDGELVVAFMPGPDGDPTAFDPTLTTMRFSAKGELDTSFGTAGTTTTLVNEIDRTAYIRKVVMQDDGKVVVLLEVNYGEFKMVRYDTNGLLDTNFDSDGMYLLPFSRANEGGQAGAGDMLYQSGIFTVFASNQNDFFMARFIDDKGTAPVAESPIANNVTQSDAGDSEYRFSIRYSDVDGNLDLSSFSNTDATVCNGDTCGVIWGTGGIWSDQSSAKVDYAMTPPGGSWDEADNGTYTISILANEVADDELNYVAADANAGSFTVSIIDPTVPDAPIMLGGTPANNGALIEFLPPASDGGASILEYKAFCNGVGNIPAFGESSPLLVTGLINGATTNCFVIARNAVGDSVASAAANVTPTDGGEVTLPPSGDGSGEAVTFTHTATNPDGGTPVTATLEVVATDPLPPEPPPAEAESLVDAIDISSTGSEAGYTMAVTFEIEPESINVFTGVWAHVEETTEDTPHWYDYGLLGAHEPGTGYELSEDRKTLTVYFTDGLRGDDDLTVNASIIDPALPIIQVDPVIFKDGFD